MSEVKRFDHVNHAHIDDCEHVESSEGAWVTASDYDALAAKLTMAEDAAAKGDAARQQCGGREMEIEELRAEAQALREEVAALRMARDDFKLERDLARQNFCDEQAANYQLQAHLKSCISELSELRARVVVVPDDLLQRCREILEWQETGILKGDALRSYCQSKIWGRDPSALRMGEGETAQEAYRFIDELARINGMTVSEGLLRRLCEPLLSHADYLVARNELRALLSEQE